MKHFFSLLLLSIILSCGSLFPKNYFEITYGFIDANSISEQEKKETVQVIKKRLNKLSKDAGVSLNSKNEIIVKLKTNFNLERVNKIILNQGKLDFWLCYSQDEIMSFVLDADEVGKNDLISNPFSTFFKGFGNNGSFNVSVQDTTKFKEYINKKEVQSLFTEDFEDLKFLFGIPSNEYVSLYSVRSNDKGRALVNETHIVEVRQDFDQVNRPAISITMNEYGAYSWAKLTNDAYKNNVPIAITLNDVVYSAPMVASGSITGGKSQISGTFNIEEAVNLSYILSTQQSIPKLHFIKASQADN